MKFNTVSCLLVALCSATSVLAEALQDPVATPASPPQYTAAEATPALVLEADEPKLEIRQNNVVNPVPTTVAVQYPSITTQWVQSTIGSSTTYLQIVYTQTFASVPDQWHTAGKGTIGYGTLTKQGKREITARETGYLQPVVLEVPMEVVTQHLQPVMEVMVLQTITIAQNMTYNGTNGMYNGTNGTYLGINGTYIGVNATLFSNGTFPSINGTYNGTNGTTSNITALSNHTFPATLRTEGFIYPTAAAFT